MSVRQMIIVFFVFLLRDALQEIPTQIEISPEQERNVGEEAMLICRSTNLMQNSVVWTKNNSRIVENDVIKDGDKRLHTSRSEQESAVVYRLVINGVQESDSGIYKCEVNDGKEMIASKETRIMVKHDSSVSQYQNQQPNQEDNYTEPRITFISRQQIRKEGDDVVLMCRVKRAGKQPVIWTKDGIPISHQERLNVVPLTEDMRYHVVKFGTEIYELKIVNLKVSDSGKYTCAVGLPQDSSTPQVTQSVTLIVNPRIQTEQPQSLLKPDPVISSVFEGQVARIPKITYVSEERAVKAGESISIRCTVENVPGTEVYWLKDNKNITDGVDTNINVTESFLEITSTLTMKNIQKSGVYSCAVSSAEFGEISEDVPVEVIWCIEPTPSIVPTSSKLKPTTGESTTLTCKVANEQNWDFLWVKDGSTIVKNDQVLYKDTRFNISADNDGSHHLWIQNVKPEDSGTYNCVLRPRGSTGTDIIRNVQLSVLFTPIVEAKNLVVIGAIGDTVKLLCDINANPPPYIIWAKGNSIIQSYRSYPENTSMSSTMYRTVSVQPIASIHKEDYGEYTCRAVNSIGIGEAKVVLKSTPTIKPVTTHRSQEIGTLATLSCIVENAPNSQVSWMKDGDKIVENNHLLLKDDRFKIYAKQDGSHHLIIEDVKLSDAGTYSCELHTPGYTTVHNSTSTTSKINLSVMFKPTVEPRESNVIRQIGDSVKIICEIRANPAARIIWLKDNEEIRDNSKYESSQPRSSKKYVVESVLRISDIDKNDYGEYTCRATNNLGTGEGKIRVTATPHIISISPELTRSTGELATLTCKVENVEDSQVIWTKAGTNIAKNEEVLIQDERLNITVDNDGSHHLHIENLVPEDFGIYTCVVYATVYAKNHGLVTIKKNVKLNVVFPPIVEPHDLVVMGSMGKTVKIQCDILANPPAHTITWIKDDSRITLSAKYEFNKQPSSTENMVESVLRISKFDSDDYGVYKCRAVSALGTDEAETEVTDSFPGTLVLTPPSVTVEETHLVLPVHSRKDLVCTVRGSPKLSVQWYKDGANVDHDHGYETNTKTVSETQVQSVLTIISLEDEYYGLYECEGSNSKGTDQATIEVTPEYAPRVTIDDESEREVAENSTIDLKCMVQASPRAQIYWYKDSRPIIQDSEVWTKLTSISAEEDVYTLHIYSFQSDHYGTYTCIARNTAGMDQKEVEIKSEEKIYVTVPTNNSDKNGKCILDIKSLKKEVTLPNTDDCSKCNPDEKYLEELMLRIADQISNKVLNKLDQTGPDCRKLDQAINNLQNRYQDIENKIRCYHNNDVQQCP